MVLADPFSACEPLSDDVRAALRANASLVLVGANDCSPEDKIQHVQDAGAQGILVTEYRSTRGLLYYYTRDKREADLRIPAVEVDATDAETIRAHLEEEEEDTRVYATIDAQDPNPMREFGELPWALYTVLLGVYGGCIVLFGASRLRGFLTIPGKRRKLAIMILVADIFTGVMRMLILVDPSGTRRLFPWPLIEFLFTLDFSFVITTNLLLAFYWDALIRARMTKNFRLQQFKWPCILTCSLMICIEVITSSLRAAWQSAMLFLIVKVFFYVIAGVASTYYFMYSTYLIWKVQVASGDINKMQRQARLRRMALLVALNSGCIILFTLDALLVLPFFPIYETPAGFFCLRFFASFFLYTACLLRVMLFVIRVDTSKSTFSSEELDSKKKASRAEEKEFENEDDDGDNEKDDDDDDHEEDEEAANSDSSSGSSSATIMDD